MDLRDLLDLAGVIRYGVPTAEKERMAIESTLPGAPQDFSAEQTAANRYAAGYLFGQQHPEIAETVQPWVDLIKVSDLPLLGGSTPEEQSYASEGVRRALMGRNITDLVQR